MSARIGWPTVIRQAWEISPSTRGSPPMPAHMATRYGAGPELCAGSSFGAVHQAAAA
jgi:hypothetical protein